jgi:hypothetical protein
MSDNNMKRKIDSSDLIDNSISEIIQDIRNKKDVSVKLIEVNKRYGIANIVDWLERSFDGSIQHRILLGLVYNYTLGYRTTEYKGRLVALREKWKNK